MGSHCRGLGRRTVAERRGVISTFHATPLWVLNTGIFVGWSLAMALLLVWPSSPVWLVVTRAVGLVVAGEASACAVYGRRWHPNG